MGSRPADALFPAIERDEAPSGDFARRARTWLCFPFCWLVAGAFLAGCVLRITVESFLFGFRIEREVIVIGEAGDAGDEDEEQEQ